MGTTRIKVIDLSSDKQDVTASRKNAQKVKKEVAVNKIPDQVGDDKTEIAKDDKVAVQNDKVENEIAASSQDSTRNDKKVGSKSTSPGKRKIRGKKYKEAVALIDKNQSYPAKDAIELLYKTSFTKFDPAVEMHLNVVAKNIKALVNFPNDVGAKTKEKKYLVFSDKHPRGELETSSGKHPAGGIIWADDKMISDLESGKLKPKRDFDVVIASPKYMPLLAKVAKILGPLGMMPNPKNGTVTDDPAKVIEGTSQAGLEIRTEPTTPVIHTKIGKLSNKPDQLEENMKALIFAVGPTKIQKAIIKSTMSPAIKIDLTTVTK